MIYMDNGAANAELLRLIGCVSTHEDKSIELGWRDVRWVEMLVYIFRGGTKIQMSSKQKPI